MQPGAERLWLSDRPRSPGQYEEDGLRRVLGLMWIAQDIETDAVNDWAMPLDESAKEDSADSSGGERKPCNSC